MPAAEEDLDLFAGTGAVDGLPRECPPVVLAHAVDGLEPIPIAVAANDPGRKCPCVMAKAGGVMDGCSAVEVDANQPSGIGPKADADTAESGCCQHLFGLQLAAGQFLISGAFPLAPPPQGRSGNPFRR